MRRINLAVAGLAAAALTLGAGEATAAKLLTSQNLALLCQPTPQDGVVGRSALADLMLHAAKVPYRLQELGMAAARRMEPGRPELVYVVAHAGEAPFGPDGVDDEAYRKARERLGEQVDLLQDDLAELGPRSTGPYRVPPGLLPRAYFAADSTAEIQCRARPAAPGEADATADDPTVQLRLARKPRGLEGASRTRADDVLAVDPAEIYFDNNIEDGATVFGVDGTAGVWMRPGGIDGRVELLSFLEYKHQSPGGASKKDDIHTVAPGVALVYTDTSPPIPYSVSLRPKLLFDLEQDSSQVVVDVTGEPAITLPGGLRVGGFTTVGELWVRPDLVAQARGASVMDAGEDSDLQGVDDYLAVGGLASLDLAMPFVTPFENLSVGFSFEHLQFVAGGMPRDNANRFQAALRYMPGQTKNVTLSFEYVNGEDMNTFQREEAYLAKLGIRY